MIRSRLAAIAACVVLTATVSTVAGAAPAANGNLSAGPALEADSVYTKPAPSLNGSKLLPVVIRLELASVADYDGGIAGYAATSPLVTGADLDANTPAVRRYRQLIAQEAARVESVVEGAVDGAVATRRLDIAFAGFTALVPADTLDAISALPGVAGVYLDTLAQLDTNVSPEFIGADNLWRNQGGIGGGGGGEGAVVGVLDSGVWPEHPSFSDPDPLGNSYDPPAVQPGSNGFSAGERSTCDFGNTAVNADDAPFTCNNKLIGAFNFTDTYKAVQGLLPTEFDSARDDNGHGTHTASTSAGNAGVEASIFGVDRGIVSGIAPRAHVVAYRVCGDTGCFGSDSVDAVGQAILDGVDVINFSISGGGSPYTDAVSLAFLDAYDAGILVTPSGGNSGPTPDSVSHREPWTLTVGASTSDRHFLSTVTLTADNADTLELVGASVTDGIDTPTPVITAVDPDCLTPDEPGTYDGEIVVCIRGVIARVSKGFNVAAGGAGGMLLYNPTQQGLSTDNHFLPAVHLENDSGDALRAFLDGHTGVTATFTEGTATAVPGDVMAPFSSRGGPGQSLGVSKPDVTAPGVQILAGNTPMPATEEGGLPGELFQSIQGTSMSAPHAAGAAALLAAAHPDWTPGQIKSALMTAADARVTNADGSDSSAFDQGSGSIRPSWANLVGFTISADAAEYVALEDELWNANYPSLYVPSLAGALTVTRTLQDVSGVDSEWSVNVTRPADLRVQVGPRPVSIPANGTTDVMISLDARAVPFGEVRHAEITFRNKASGQLLRFPVTIVRGTEGVSVDKTCESGIVLRNAPTTCSVSVTNNTFDAMDVRIRDSLPTQLGLDPDSVVNGSAIGTRTVIAATELDGQSPAIVSIAPDPGGSPAGFLPLADFGVAPFAGNSDESIANFNTPAFSYAGVTYTRIGVVSNGYAVVGGGDQADVDFINTPLPDPARPNNVLAPFWTDLNPSEGGDMYVAVLGDGVSNWIVIEWNEIQNYSDGVGNSFQVWIGINGTEDITFTYGDVSAGDSGFLTVGAENDSGTSGDAVYVDGEGTAPAAGDEYRVSSTPGTPGETYTVSFDVLGRRWGPFRNAAIVTSPSLATRAIATFEGKVVVSSTRRADLSAANEVPPPDSGATGSATIRANRSNGVVCAEITAQDLTGAVVAGHIHAGAAGVNGPVVVNLGVDSADFNDCVSGVEPSLIADILANPANYYVNVHTDAVPSGEIRGQLG